MASIQVQGSGGGKKAVDSEIPLVPFIDLLLCCIMFLLVTAVWNQLARIDVSQRQGPAPTVTDPPPETPELSVEVREAGYVLGGPAGERVEIPRAGERYDLVALRARLADYRRLAPNLHEARLISDDDIDYSDVIATLHPRRHRLPRRHRRQPPLVRSRTRYPRGLHGRR
jgi:biopolymer transport protein ExbD